MKFSENIIRSFVDLPNKTSMIIYSIGCNLHCYKCFVYETLVAHPMKTCNEETILEKIKQNGFLFDSLIISGGEFLINNLQEISNFLKRIRIVFNGIVIINTNGFYPDKMSVLCKEKLVDGFHLDIKLPPHIQLSPLIIKDIYGIETDINNVYKSANIIAKHNSQYSQFRTVKYPILDDEYFNEIERYVNQVNQTHRSHIEWHLNEFVEGDSI